MSKGKNLYIGVLNFIHVYNFSILKLISSVLFFSIKVLPRNEIESLISYAEVRETLNACGFNLLIYHLRSLSSLNETTQSPRLISFQLYRHMMEHREYFHISEFPFYYFHTATIFLLPLTLPVHIRRLWVLLPNDFLIILAFFFTQFFFIHCFVPLFFIMLLDAILSTISQRRLPSFVIFSI